ncbi:MAG: endonuclease III [Ignavibacteria bacterium]|nr:endonuclease III [Ignavibacteria bacterium]
MKNKVTKMQTVIGILRQEYPDAFCALTHSSAFELLIATILSAKCTDARVNIVTRDLFQKYRSPADYVAVERAELESDIHSTGFFKNKAKNIQECCRAIIERFGGEVPDTMEELITLAGVGRKTANVLLGNWFGKNEGITVDTHVTRLMNLLGFVQTTNPEIIERELMPLVPKELWTDFTHFIISHGREICIARRPKCHQCSLSHLCPSSTNDS